MTAIDEDAAHDRRYQELRLRVQQRHAAVRALADADEAAAVEVADDEVAAVEALVAATDQLLAFEDRLPVLRDLPARALSFQVVRASALATLLGGVLIVLGIWQGPLGWVWSPIVLVMAAAALRTATLPVAPAAGAHRRQRYVSAGCGATALLVGPAAMWEWPAGLLLAVVHALCLAVLLELFATLREQE